MLLVGNWKAYIEKKEVAKTLFDAAKKVSAKSKHRIVLAPSAPYMGMLCSTNRSKVAFAAQDISNSTGGAETGEVTASSLKGLGVTYAIIGHSERRAMGETNEIVSSKVRHALAQGLTPIVCVGEKERDSEAQYLQVLRQQITSAYKELSSKEALAVVLAYEPLWAIGPQAIAAITPEDLQEMILYIRKILSDVMPGRANEKVVILYGGSVDTDNVKVLAHAHGVGGFLIGRASTNPKTFTSIVQAIPQN